MPGNIRQDHRRFKEIVDGKVRKNLKKFISHGGFELPAKRGKGKIIIPIPHIDIPRFRYETREQEHVGQGKGEAGDVLGSDEEGEGTGRAGDQPGEHGLEEVELSQEEFFKMLGEELELPRIEPKGKKTTSKEHTLKGISKTGPDSLRQFRRTYKEALKRQIASGTYDYRNPIIVPIGRDKRYRAFKIKETPKMSAAIFHLIDISGSMADEQREIVRRITFCVDGWIDHFYDEVEQRYVTHDAEAREVDREEFFFTDATGGTIISSGLGLVADIIDAEYPVDDWNIYIFYFSDGDNWSGADNKKCKWLLRERILPNINLFCFGYTASPYGGDKSFYQMLTSGKFKREEKLTIATLEHRDDIIEAIKTFLGKGK